MEDWTTNRRAVGKAEKDFCVQQIAMVLPRVEVKKVEAPKVVETKVENLAPAYKSVAYKPAPWKPVHAAVKRNGGLRGSTATRWK